MLCHLGDLIGALSGHLGARIPQTNIRRWDCTVAIGTDCMHTVNNRKKETPLELPESERARVELGSVEVSWV